MANFAAVQNTLEGIINNQLTAARQTQGVWEWYNALQRITSQNRYTGSIRVVGPKATLDAGTAEDVETSAITLFGLLVDNSNSGEDVWLVGYDIAAASVTVGTSLTKIVLWVPRASIVPVVYADGFPLGTAFSVHALTGTQAALEGSTGVTGTNPTFVAVYSE